MSGKEKNTGQSSLRENSQGSPRKRMSDEGQGSPQSPIKKYFGEETPGNRKKKKTEANKDIRKERFAYNEYVERRSILDHVYGDSLIATSPFRGLLRFILIIAIIYVINHLTVNID